MSVYAFSGILLMERTARLTCSAASGAANAQTIPTISAGSKTIRPIGFSIVDASADFELEIGTATDLGDQIDIVAADLAANNQWTFALGEDDIIVMDDGAGAATVDVRWYWPNGARDGVVVGTSHGVLLPVKTEEVSQNTTEAALTIPTGAVELVIQDLDTGSLLYRVDDGTANGQQLTIADAMVSPENPYSIYVNDGDRLRLDAAAGTVVMAGYWRIAR